MGRCFALNPLMGKPIEWFKMNMEEYLAILLHIEKLFLLTE